MSTLHHESILESLYEEVIEEATDTGHIHMMSVNDIQAEVIRRFQDLCQ